MKTLKTSLIAFPALALLSALSTVKAATPAELTATHCLICHGDPQAGNPRLAPPFMMVKMHYQDLKEEEFVKAVSAWVKKPDPAKSRMPGAVNRFGLMPPLPYSDADVAAISKYLFKTDFAMPGHGGQGMGRGMGAGKAVGEGAGCASCAAAATEKGQEKGKAGCASCAAGKAAATKGEEAAKGCAGGCHSGKGAAAQAEQGCHGECKKDEDPKK